MPRNNSSKTRESDLLSITQTVSCIQHNMKKELEHPPKKHPS